MASKTSERNVVDRGTSGGKSYYNTDITTLADGTVQRDELDDLLSLDYGKFMLNK